LDAGVFWDVQNVLLEDVDRIEVVSGPGGTLWGANAVNGVINIVTKSARDTQGLLIEGAVDHSCRISAPSVTAAATARIFFIACTVSALIVTTPCFQLEKMRMIPGT